MQMIVSLPYLESFSDPIISGAKGPSEYAMWHLAYFPAFRFPCSQHPFWPYRIACRSPNKPCVFIHCTAVHANKWNGLPCPVSIWWILIHSSTLSLNFTASQECSLTFQGRMCSNNTLLFRGNEIELEQTHLQLASRPCLLFAVVLPPKPGDGSAVWLS